MLRSRMLVLHKARFNAVESQILYKLYFYVTLFTLLMRIVAVY